MSYLRKAAETVSTMRRESSFRLCFVEMFSIVLSDECTGFDKPCTAPCLYIVEHGVLVAALNQSKGFSQCFSLACQAPNV